MRRMTGPSMPHFLPCTPARVRVGARRAFRALVMAAEARRLRLTATDPDLDAVPEPGVSVVVQVEEGSRVLRFESRVLPGVGLPRNGFWLVRPRLPSAYREEQERATLRQAMQCPVVASARAAAPAVLVRGHTLDLGGGGALLLLASELPRDARVALRLVLEPGREPLSVDARVLECASAAKQKGFEVRVAFEAVPDAIRAAILRACFRHQIERARRRLV